MHRFPRCFAEFCPPTKRRSPCCRTLLHGRKSRVKFLSRLVFGHFLQTGSEGARSFRGPGLVGVGGPPRIGPCDALPRLVPARGLASLTGAPRPPQPRPKFHSVWSFVFPAPGWSHLARLLEHGLPSLTRVPGRDDFFENLRAILGPSDSDHLKGTSKPLFAASVLN